jgi:uncharacterized protein YidB (DUF937 family)
MNVMGILDSVLGQVLGRDAQQQGAGLPGLASVLGGLLVNSGSHGGLPGLVSKFEQAGLGEVIGSWIGKGANQPISRGQLQSALGEDTVASLASSLGIDAHMLLPMLVTALPALIDHLTPHGKMPEDDLSDQSNLLSSS